MLNGAMARSGSIAGTKKQNLALILFVLVILVFVQGSDPDNINDGNETSGTISEGLLARALRSQTRALRRRKQRQQAQVADNLDPKSVAPRAKRDPEEHEQLSDADEVAEAQRIMAEMADHSIVDGSPAFRVHHPTGGDENAAFVPDEIWIEVINARPDCKYSVTVVSHRKYTGTAMRIPPRYEGDRIWMHSWKPIFPGRYDVLVHEIGGISGETPLIQPPFPVFIREGQRVDAGMSMLEDRIHTMPPCQQQGGNPYAHWEGDWLGPDFGLEENLRTGWSFLPRASMGCKIETFTPEMLWAIPKKKSIVILGRSVERGIFLSLVDLLLDNKEKKLLRHSVIAKCWGRATVAKGNLEVMYQDFRVNAFEDPTEPRFIECHNEKIVKEPGSSFIANATEVWEEIFDKADSERWPSVIFLVTGRGSAKFSFEHHVQFFVKKLPPAWRGTLFLGDYSFSARAAGLVDTRQYESYLEEIKTMSDALDDPRVRWIDGNGMSKEHRMWAQNDGLVARSQHFHNICSKYDISMVACSNVTEIAAQVLLGHALGPKQEFLEWVEQSPKGRRSHPMRWCHACPSCMLPFHITPYPKMECVNGPITRKTYVDDCSMVRVNGAGSVDEAPSAVDRLTCPADCLANPATSEFATESDMVYVRQCPIVS